MSINSNRSSLAQRIYACALVSVVAIAGCVDDGAATTPEESIALAATSYIAVAAGDAHSLALRSDGAVFAAGDNWAGQLGNGGTHATGAGAPTRVASLPPVAAIAAGCSHSLALTSGGTIWAWGNNSSGQLGIGTTVSRTTPAAINVSGVVFTAIAAGCFHSLALDSTGAVWTWGANSQGQLGNHTFVNSATPVKLGLQASAIEGGDEFSLAIRTTGSVVFAWGRNDSGQLGNGTTVPSNFPAATSLSGMGSISAGAAHGIASGTTGIFAWGSNTSCALSSSANGIAFNATPVKVTSSSAFGTNLSAGRYFSVVSSLSGFGGGLIVTGWGRNDVGQLGIGSTSSQNCFVTTAARFPNGGMVVPSPSAGTLAAGSSHALVIDSTGKVLAWGANSLGQLGVGSTVASVWAQQTLFP